MTGFDRLERDLAVWLEDTAGPKVPDYVDDVVARAVGHRQRPRWTFAARWLPGPVTGIGLPRLPIRLRTMLVLAVLTLLLILVAAVVGSRQRLPPPFGPASNGLVTFMRNGDIYTFDPESRVEVPVVTGPEIDFDPIPGEETAQIFADFYNTPPALIEQARRVTRPEQY